MNYIHCSELEGKHATLAPSKHGWENKTIEETLDAEARSYAADIGTAVHDFCRKRIKRHKKINANFKEELKFLIMEYYDIPAYAFNRGVDFDMIFDTAKIYANDAIGFRLLPEEQLFYDKIDAFGTADAISELDSVFAKRMLRIHDLKTGVREVDMTQLCKYAALFCLQYNVKPIDIQTELRIYQYGTYVVYVPEPDEILFYMDNYKTKCEALRRMRLEES